jgi:hypothetical protein
MLKKLSLVLSVLAALGFAIATSAPADAAQPKNKVVRTNTVRTNVVRTNRTVNVRTNRAVGVNRAVRGNFVVGRRYGGHVWYGHNRHRWHGQWYGYGEGPCWINVDGEWFWNELVCPL